MAATFVEYFTNRNKLNLEVEVISSGENFIEIVYFSFSDEKINTKEFLKRIKASRLEMWRLIQKPEQYIQVSEAIPNKIVLDNDSIVSKNDAIVNLVGLLLKISLRLPINKINKKELNGLINSISVKETLLENQSSEFEFVTLKPEKLSPDYTDTREIFIGLFKNLA